MVAIIPIFTLTLAAAAQLTSAATTWKVCEERHPKQSKVQILEPYFTKTHTTGNVIINEWKNDNDGTIVQHKHSFSHPGELAVIKTTKDRKKSRVELIFVKDGNVYKRHFKVKKNNSCIIDTDGGFVQGVSYYKFNKSKKNSS